MGIRVLNSSEDRSVNFVEEQLVGFLESRFVRKCDDYFICYLSSQTGCNRGCAFCHLTATGQTSFADSTHNDFMGQALQVLKHYKAQGKPAQYMHYNFMARGEPLANKVLLESSAASDGLLMKLAQLARDEDLPAKFNVSTIMPVTFKGSLIDVFPTITPTIYYSLYSMRSKFRDKWMPGAMPVDEALRRLKEYQDFSKKIVKVHHAFIAGENDGAGEVAEMVMAIRHIGLVCEFNLVRYNPASPEQGQESDEDTLKEHLDFIGQLLHGAKMIQRVGFDVKASCGMFV